MILKAVNVEYFQENEARVVSFSDGNGDYLILQKSNPVGEQDKSLELDGTHLQNLHMADYGIIVKIVVANSLISISFANETAELFRFDNPLVIAIVIRLDWRKLIASLSFIAGTECVELSE